MDNDGETVVEETLDEKNEVEKLVVNDDDDDDDVDTVGKERVDEKKEVEALVVRDDDVATTVGGLVEEKIEIEGGKEDKKGGTSNNWKAIEILKEILKETKRIGVKGARKKREELRERKKRTD